MLASADLAKNFAGVIIVSGWLGAETAGGYFAAERTSNVLSFILISVTLVLSPHIARYYHEGNKNLVRILIGLVGFTAGLAALIGLIVFILIGAEVLALFNTDYSGYLPVLLLLSLGQFFAAISGPVGGLMVLAGYERITLVVVVSVSLITVVLQAIGAQFWGLLGVATATLIGFLLLSLFRIVFAAKWLGIDSTGLTLVVRYCRDRLMAPGR